MAELSSENAIDSARAATGVDASVPARAWRVRRLDQPKDSYYLVVFGESRAAIALAAVGATRGEIQTWARLPGHGPHPTLEPNIAAERAGLAEGARAELVWEPCRASRSQLYPLWEISTAAKTVYVDQQGSVWPELVTSGPGG
jgi:hypothetical protein